jgi:hypothetical protein
VRSAEHPVPAASPLGPSSRREEVARCAVFLAWADAAYRTGADLVVDGASSSVLPVPHRRRHTDQRGPPVMLTRHGTMATDRPARYAKQLAGHWARRGTSGEEDGATVIRFETGQVVVLHPEDRLLRIEASVPDDVDADPDRFARVVSEHLQRFGQREELEVVWNPPLTA